MSTIGKGAKTTWRPFGEKLEQGQQKKPDQQNWLKRSGGEKRWTNIIASIGG